MTQSVTSSVFVEPAPLLPAEKDFWAQKALENLDFFKPWTEVFSWQNRTAQWFAGAQLNASYQALDRHVQGGRGAKIALIFENELGDVQKISYAELLKDVCQLAQGLTSLGVVAGDRVAIYLPLSPQAVVAMLACSRIGAVHTVVFGGFSPSALKDRLIDCGAKILVTADFGWRKGQKLNMQALAESACEGVDTLEHVVVWQRENATSIAAGFAGRGIFWHTLVENTSDFCEPIALDAEHPLFILYTSGTTGKPKGLVHTLAGYMLGATFTTRHIFDPQEKDIYWCTADVGWITGHTYVAYGPLSCGATVFLYEGAPLYPTPSRFWQIVERHKISILYTAPTAIRAFIQCGDEWVTPYDLSSLRLLGTVGEPINPDAWQWFYNVVGGGRCPIVDTWWQTETGAAMIAPQAPYANREGAKPKHEDFKPGCATRPLPGISVGLYTPEGDLVETAGESGLLCLTKPWPSLARTIYGDHERYLKTYWQILPGLYVSGDGAHQDADGDIWILGRVDDVVNVSGHRLGTRELESALATHHDVAECAVVGKPDALKGQGIVAFVVVKGGVKVADVDAFKAQLNAVIATHIGRFALADHIYLVKALPKTRSGKILRRLLREIASSGTFTGDTSTLEDLAALEGLKGAVDEG